MRIVIDLQGAQNDSRFRGIGRYTIGLAKGLLRHNSKHEIFLVLNEVFPDSIKPICAIFEGLLPKENIRTLTSPVAVSHCRIQNDWNREAAEMLREVFLLSLQPDLVLVSSLFEGAGDNVVTSIGNFTDKIATAVILYDLIPLLNKEAYLANEVLERWYQEKLQYLTRANICLAISESSRQEGIKHLLLDENSVINISAASDEKFTSSSVSQNSYQKIFSQWNINRPFVMYSGSTDPRKNHLRLISAYSKLPSDIRRSHQLVIAGKLPQDHVDTFKIHAESVGLTSDELVITRHIDDEVMAALYKLCKCFIFPSWHEGFGLPALEAMSCGAAVIGSNTSSVPEVIGNIDALFDPFNEASITEKLNQVLTNQEFRERLIKHGMEQSKKFSWDITAQTALAVLENFLIADSDSNPTRHLSSLKQGDGELVSALIDSIATLKSEPQNQRSIKNLATCIYKNFPDASSERAVLLSIGKVARVSLRNRIRSVLPFMSRL